MMRNKKLLIAVLCLIILTVIIVSLIAYFKLASQKNTLVQVKIQPDRETYAAYMSSTVGIGLTAEYTLDIPLESVQFHWITNYGYFVSWGPVDYKVNILEKNITTGNEEIYWSYDPEEAQKEKPPVKITVRIEDSRSGKILGVATLDIIWENIYTAKVINF